MEASEKPPSRYSRSAAFCSVFSACTLFCPPVWHAAVRMRSHHHDVHAHAARGISTVVNLKDIDDQAAGVRFYRMRLPEHISEPPNSIYNILDTVSSESTGLRFRVEFGVRPRGPGAPQLLLNTVAPRARLAPAEAG